MDIFSLSRAWFNFCFENPEKIKPNHTALYFFCIEHCNRLGWKEKFGLPTTMAKEAIGIHSYNTFINTLNDLVNWGFIKILERSKNQHSSNIVALSNFNKAHNKALDKAIIKHASKHLKSTHQSTGESISSIDIPIYQETNIPINHNTNIPDVTDKYTFDEFWILYDKKVDKANTKKKYSKLSVTDREKIFTHIPRYKLKTPDVKYRKNPDTYLNNRCWEDDELPLIETEDPKRRFLTKMSVKEWEVGE